MKRSLIDIMKRKIISKIVSLVNKININRKLEDYPLLKNTSFSWVYDDFQSHNIEIIDFDEQENFVYYLKQWLKPCNLLQLL